MSITKEKALMRLEELGLEPSQEVFEKNIPKGDSETLRLLIEAGANPEAPDNQGYTPLMNAVMFNNEDAVRCLLSYNVRMNTANRYGKTALMMAVISGNETITQLLLHNNADPNMESTSGETPLALAVKSSNLKIIVELLEHGAKPDFGSDGQQPLELAKKLNKEPILKLFSDYESEAKSIKPETEIPVEPKKNPVSYDIFNDAIAENNIEDVSRWLDEGQNPDFRGREGYTPLMIATSHGHYEILKLLVSHKVKLDRKNRNGYTALHVAVISNIPRAVELLLDAGANPNITSNSGDTPLIKAMIFLNNEIISLLLDYNADVNTQNVDGYNALAMAIMKHDNKIVEKLLKNGADPLEKVKNETAVDRAKRLGFADTVSLIEKYH